MDLVNRCIRVTIDNEMEVLKVLEELGFTWGGSQLSGSLKKPTKYTPINDGWVCGDIYLEIPEDKEISFMNGNKVYLMRGMNEITLEELKSFLPNNIPKVIRKLKDLDGLKNDKGWELSFESTDNFKDKGYYQEWVRLDDKSNKGWFDAFYELTDKAIDLLKTCGFEFEYKPLRGLEEVRDEIRNLKSLPFIHGESNYIVACDAGKWYIDNLTHIDTLSTYMAKEQAQKYADELNEIIGGK